MRRFTLSLLLTFIIFLSAYPTSSHAWVKTSEESYHTGMQGLEGRKIITKTNYRNDGSGEWLKSSTKYQFRTTNGKSCKVKATLNSRTNAKLRYSTGHMPSSGRWGGDIIVVQKKEGTYRWNIHFDFDWN